MSAATPNAIAEQRYQRDKGHEPGAPPGPQVAQPDEEFDGVDHRLALNHIRPERGDALWRPGIVTQFAYATPAAV